MEKSMGLAESTIKRLLNIAAKDHKRTTEHPVYHPEGRTINHIKIVALRALVWNPELYAAAVIHDICKPLSGFWREDKGYWTNRDHALQAARLCDRLTPWIESVNCDPELTKFVVRRHMDFKHGWKKCPEDKIAVMEAFEKLDNMVSGIREPKLVKTITIPKSGKRLGTIFHNQKVCFIGVAPVHYNYPKLTVTIGRTPFTYSFDSQIIINNINFNDLR